MVRVNLRDEGVHFLIHRPDLASTFAINGQPTHEVRFLRVRSPLDPGHGELVMVNEGTEDTE